MSRYNRYTDVFAIEDVPEAERKEAAQSAADRVIDTLEKHAAESAMSCGKADDPRAS